MCTSTSCLSSSSCSTLYHRVLTITSIVVRILFIIEVLFVSSASSIQWVSANIPRFRLLSAWPDCLFKFFSFRFNPITHLISFFRSVWFCACTFALTRSHIFSVSRFLFLCDPSNSLTLTVFEIFTTIHAVSSRFNENYEHHESSYVLAENFERDDPIRATSKPPPSPPPPQ